MHTFSWPCEQSMMPVSRPPISKIGIAWRVWTDTSSWRPKIVRQRYASRLSWAWLWIEVER
jgi:hypothetical protein